MTHLATAFLSPCEALTHWRHKRSSTTHDRTAHSTMSAFVLSCDLIDDALRFVVPETWKKSA